MAGRAEQVTPVVRELVDVVGRRRHLAEHRGQQLPLVEEDGVEGQQREQDRDTRRVSARAWAACGRVTALVLVWVLADMSGSSSGVSTPRWVRERRVSL